MEEDEANEYTDPKAVLARLRAEFDPKNPKETDILRIKLQALCEGMQITEEERAELLKLGYDEATVGTRTATA
jgi:hypothetical protein